MLIIDTFEDPFLNLLSYETVGYDNRTSLDFIAHLLTYHDMIAPTELMQNYDRLTAPYDTNLPIVFAVTRGQPYGNTMVVNDVYTLVLFPDARCAWQACTTAQKTWMQFKIDFSVACGEFCLTNQAALQSGFHSANTMIKNNHGELLQGTTDAKAQFSVTPASDRRTVATLAATNGKLTSQLEEAQAYTKKLNQEMQDLKIKIKTA
jgi:hypothetical protein